MFIDVANILNSFLLLHSESYRKIIPSVRRTSPDLWLYRLTFQSCLGTKHLRCERQRCYWVTSLDCPPWPLFIFLSSCCYYVLRYKDLEWSVENKRTFGICLSGPGLPRSLYIIFPFIVPEFHFLSRWIVIHCVWVMNYPLFSQWIFRLFAFPGYCE